MKFTDNNITPSLDSKILGETASEDKGYFTPQQLKTLIVPSLGANVATALAKPVGTIGSVQLSGDVQNPSAIQLPDITDLISPYGYIGLKKGFLSVSDGDTTGGKYVSGRGIKGFYNNKNQDSTFSKRIDKFKIEQLLSSSNFDIYGQVSIYADAEFYDHFYDVVEIGVGFAWNENSNLDKDHVSQPWIYASLHPIAGTATEMGVVKFNVSCRAKIMVNSFDENQVLTNITYNKQYNIYVNGNDSVKASNSLFGLPYSISSPKNQDNELWVMVYLKDLYGSTQPYICNYDLNIETSPIP